jgi:hypothetical protein
MKNRQATRKLTVEQKREREMERSRKMFFKRIRGWMYCPTLDNKGPRRSQEGLFVFFPEWESKKYRGDKCPRCGEKHEWSPDQLEWLQRGNRGK